jgi:hypothetical protein
MRLTVTVPDAVAEHARQLAARTGQSVSAVVATAVERHVAEARRRLAFDSIDALIGSGDGDAESFDQVLGTLRQASDRDLA